MPRRGLKKSEWRRMRRRRGPGRRGSASEDLAQGVARRRGEAKAWRAEECKRSRTQANKRTGSKVSYRPNCAAAAAHKSHGTQNLEPGKNWKSVPSMAPGWLAFRCTTAHGGTEEHEGESKAKTRNQELPTATRKATAAAAGTSAA